MENIKYNKNLILKGLSIFTSVVLLSGVVGCASTKKMNQSTNPTNIELPNENINSNEPVMIKALPSLEIKDIVSAKANIDKMSKEIRTIMDEYNKIDNVFIETNELSAAWFITNDIIEVINTNSSGSTTNYFATKNLACADIKLNSKLSDFWFDLQQNDEYKDAFKAMVSNPVDRALESGNYEELLDLSNQCVDLDGKSQFSNLCNAIYWGCVESKKQEVPGEIFKQIQENDQKIMDYYTNGEYAKDPVYIGESSQR